MSSRHACLATRLISQKESSAMAHQQKKLLTTKLLRERFKDVEQKRELLEEAINFLIETLDALDSLDEEREPEEEGY